MRDREAGHTSNALSLLALALVVVGLLEAIGIGLLVSRHGVPAMRDEITSPTTLWTLWLAVVLTVLSDAMRPGVRYTVAVAALVAGSFRAGLEVVARSAELAGDDASLVALRTMPQLLGPLLLALWALVDALRRRDARRAVEARPPIPAPRMLPPLERPRSSPGTPTVRRPAPVRSAAGTAVLPGQSWTSVGSPWPRAVEEDPDGTLVRPPRRRAAN